MREEVNMDEVRFTPVRTADRTKIARENKRPYKPFETEVREYLEYIGDCVDDAWEVSYASEWETLSGSFDELYIQYEKIYCGVHGSIFGPDEFTGEYTSTYLDFDYCFRQKISGHILLDVLATFGLEFENGENSTNGKKTAIMSISWNDDVIPLRSTDRKESRRADITVVLRLYRSQKEILFLSLTPVMEILIKNGKNGGGADEALALAAENRTKYLSAQRQLNEEILCLLRELDSDALSDDERRKKVSLVEEKRNIVFQCSLGLEALSAFERQVRDYCGDGEIEGELSKRILRDILVPFDWSYEVAGYLTRNDIQKIYADKHLLIDRKGIRAVFVKDLRDVSTMRDFYLS